MKKIVALCLVVSVLLFCMVGCGNKDQTDKQEAKTKTEQDAKADKKEAKKKVDKKEKDKEKEEADKNKEKSSVDSNSSAQQQSSSSGGDKNSVSNQSTPKAYTCTIKISCKNLVGNSKLKNQYRPYVPSGGVIVGNQKITIRSGDTVLSILLRIASSKGISVVNSGGGASNAYISSINNLPEGAAGGSSGWMYRVNGVFPKDACGVHKVKNGDVIEWAYTCNFGNDL